MEFGEIIKKERLKRGMSKRELAEKVGVSKRAVIYWENGERIMSVENADKVLKALNVSFVIGVDRKEI